MTRICHLRVLRYRSHARPVGGSFAGVPSGRSSVGGAQPCQGGGREFEPRRPLGEDGRSLRGGVAERRGNGLQIRLHGFKSRLHLDCSDSRTWGAGSSRAIGAVVARFLDTEEVTGSNPVSPTSITAGHRPV